jgi:hypothetical protein
MVRMLAHPVGAQRMPPKERVVKVEWVRMG